MTYLDILEHVAIDAGATLVILLLGSVIAFIWKLWCLPALQEQTIREIRQLRKSIMKLTAVISGKPQAWDEEEDKEDVDR